jgi:hypothetical protein
MKIKLSSDAEHKMMLAVCELIMDKQPPYRSPLGKALRLFAEMVAEYEKVRWPIPEPKLRKKR